MKDSIKEIAKYLTILLFFVAAYLIYGKLSEPRIPELDSHVVSFSKNVSFGATVNAASAHIGSEESLSIDSDNAKKEIDATYDLGADLVRFNLERRTLESADEMEKLDGVVSYAQGKNMKIYLAYLGRNSWLGSGEGAGKANWEDFKKGYEADAVFLMAKYKPDYFLILPECSYNIGRQVNSKRAMEEWYDFAKEVGLAIKRVSFSTKIALEGTMLSSGAKSADVAFAERVLSSNDAAINIFSMNVGSATELEKGMENLLNMKKKYHWEGEIWMGNVGISSDGDVQKQKDFLLYAIHLTNRNDFSGIILGQLRDGAGDKNGIVTESYGLKNSYTAIKEVMGDRR